MKTDNKNKLIHLEIANTLEQFLPENERYEVVSLKITGNIGRKDFDDVLDEMCDSGGYHDADENVIIDFESAPLLRHLDLGEATYVDGDCLPFFGFLSQLETLILPKGIKTTLDNGESETGFSESEMLKILDLPEGLKIVGGFDDCQNLTELVLPEGLKEICPFAFCGCKAITSIRIPSSVKVFNGSCFAYCDLKEYVVDEDNPYYTAIDGVVYSKDLTKLVAFPSAYPKKHFLVPDTTRIIGDSAFMGSCIESIELPDGLTTIEGWAFQGSTIHRIDIPDSVTEIGELTFRFCKELEYVRLSRGITTIPSQLFSSCSKLKDLDIPSNVRSIYYSAIAWCDGLEYLHLHEGLEEIVEEGTLIGHRMQFKDALFPKTLKNAPGGIFNYSYKFKTFKVDPENPYFTAIDGALCSKDGKVLISVPDAERTNYIVPNGIEVIDKHVFAFHPNLESVELPSTLKVIRTRAFQSCDALKSLRIPASVEKVDIDSLWADPLKTIIMEGSVPPEMTGDIRDDEWRYGDVELCVPEDALSAYKSAPGWKCFNVIEIKMK